MDLPKDLLVEILSRLPVKPLTRFRSVCKSWRALVDDPAFISNHLNNHQTTARLLVSHRDVLTNNRLVSSFTTDNLDTLLHHHVPSFLNEKFGHIRLIGPCNGLICLYGFPDNVALWNPATRDSKTLPVSRIPRPVDARVLGGDLGFGFDYRTNDYKAVQILFCSSSRIGVSYQVEIYNLSTNSWRKFGATVPANIMYMNIWSMLFRSEVFCWWAKDGETEIILSFDMGDETFQKTPLPSDAGVLGGVRRTMRAIVPIDESVGLVVYPLKQTQKLFDVWVLRGFGAEGVWTKLSIVGPLSGVERPLGFWKNGEMILESSCGQLVLYDPRDQKMRNLGLQGKRDRLEVLLYKESLVSLANSGNYQFEMLN
ncbi:hypothetical protein U1Q18_014691 [Sarracenia purpurea var. burkii]